MGQLVLVAVVIVVVLVVMLGQGVYWVYRGWQESQSQEVARRLGLTLGDNEARLLKITLGDQKAEPTDSQLEVWLNQAGQPYPMRTLQIYMAGAAGLGFFLGLAAMRGPLGVMGLAAGLIPALLIRSQANSRIRRLTEQLPDAVDLMARSLQAGHGLTESMRMAAEELPDPIGPEFGRVYEENNLGRDLRECLQNLLRRNPGCFDLQIFVSSVLLQRDTGGNLVEILQSIAKTVRSRFLFEGKLAALTSEARFTAWVLGSLPFFVTGMISFRNPAYLDPLFTDPLGNLLLGLCVCMFSFGVFLMSDFSKVEV